MKKRSVVAGAGSGPAGTNVPSLQRCCPAVNSRKSSVRINCENAPSSAPGGRGLPRTSAIERVARKLEKIRARKTAPRIDSFADFLLNHARVKSGAGYVPYHFAGREALRGIVDRLDEILASGATDASLAICGGAQFGKTVLMLNLLAYLVAVRFRNVGYYLPDDDLVQGIVDGKLRPDVLDQVPWLARLIAVGKTLTATGRAANRKGAFLCTDGARTALAFMRGLGKIPTSFSMDVVVQDEKDDLPDEHARFLAGRMTASNLRLSLIIGTQRYHGAGQNLAFTEGTQHVGLLRCTGLFGGTCSCPSAQRGKRYGTDGQEPVPPMKPSASGCGARVNPETAWPGVCRLIVDGQPSSEWPRLTAEGHFDRINKINGIGKGRESGAPNAANPLNHIHPVQKDLEFTGSTAYSPDQKYALCCPDCGALLDREHHEWHAQAPEREKLRRWSYRISQLLIPAIELEQIVAAWQLAVRDSDQMGVFCTDRLALPKATTQTLTPAVLEAARGDYLLEKAKGKGQSAKGGDGSEADVSPPALFPSPFAFHYGGLDLGDQCWFVARAVDAKPPHNVRLLWVEPIAAERVRTRVPELFRELNLRALCVDAGPLRDLARDLVFELNGLTALGGPGYLLPGCAQRTGSESVAMGQPLASCRPAAAGRSGQQVAQTTRQLRATWHEPAQKWRNLRAMAVEFTQREGAGLRHKYAQTQEGRAYPLLAANRDETIDRIVQELLPPGVGDPRLVENPDGTAASAPTQRFFLPAKTETTRDVLDLYERHLLAGARTERDGKQMHYLTKCENHFLLATAYAALAELIAPPGGDPPAPAVQMFRPAPRTAQERSLIG